MSASHAAPAQFAPTSFVSTQFVCADEPPGILLVESNRDGARAIRADLERGGFRSRLARGAAEALAWVHARGFTAVVLNLDLNGDDAPALLGRLRSLGDGPILTLCGNGDVGSRVRAFAAGADDCLPLPYHPGEFVARLRAHLRRASHLTRVGSLVLQPQTYLASFDGRPVRLRRGEFRVLRLLASDPGRVFGRGDIERALWLEESALHSNAVNMQVSNLRKKLEAAGLQGALRTGRGVGYALRPERLQGH